MKLVKNDLPLGGDVLNQIVQKLQQHYKDVSEEEKDPDILAADLST